MNYSENLQYNQIEVQRGSTYIHWWKLQNFFPMNSTFQLNLHQHIYICLALYLYFTFHNNSNLIV
jgi:hypothetical protein